MKRTYLLLLCLISMMLNAQSLGFLLEDVNELKSMNEIRDYMYENNLVGSLDNVYDRLSKGNRFAWIVFCRRFKKDPGYKDLYVYCLKNAAYNGDNYSKYRLARLYRKGINLERNYSYAVELLKSASDKNFHPAITGLGYMYFKGFGVNQDYPKAVELFREAVDLRQVAAIHLLGYCYEHGYGVEKDIEEAIKLYERAKGSGYKQSIVRLGILENSLKSSKGLFTDENIKFTYSAVSNDELTVGNIDGTYEATVYLYDWSKKNVIRCIDNIMEIQINNNRFSVNFNSSVSSTDKCVGEITGNNLNLTNCYFNYQSAYGGQDSILIESCRLSSKNDSVIFGELKLCSKEAHEEFNPCIISLKRKVDIVEIKSKESLTIYPNPVKDILEIRYSLLDIKPVQCKIFNTNGILIKNKQFEVADREGELSMNTDELKPGLYILKFNNITKRFVKK